jgi:hypothetical protein
LKISSTWFSPLVPPFLHPRPVVIRHIDDGSTFFSQQFLTRLCQKQKRNPEHTEQALSSQRKMVAS